MACGLDRTETRSAKDAERGDGPHFADPVRNDVFFFARWGARLRDFADMGRSNATPLRRARQARGTARARCIVPPTMEWFDREVKTNEDRSECGGSQGLMIWLRMA